MNGTTGLPTETQHAPTAETFTFRCACGAKLRSTKVAVGKRGKCKTCGAVVVIPAPPTGDSANARNPAGQVEEPLTAIALVGSCSVCQCTIAEQEPLTNCSECGLPYHIECWEANFGCAAYGCRNVNILRTGPDISLPNAPHSQESPGLPGEAPSLPRNDDIPWEFVLLAASVVLGLLSLVTCGFPSLLVAGAAGMVLAVKPQSRIEILALVWGIAGISSLGGLMVSFYLWGS